MTIATLNARPEIYAANLISASDFSNPVKIFNRIAERNQGNILESLLAGSGIGMWLLELHNGEINFCPVAKSYFNIAPEKEPTLHDIFKALNKQERSLLIKAFENVCKENGDIEREVKILDNHGHILWLKITGRLYRETINPAAGLLAGTIQDITKEKLIAQQKEDCIALLSHELRSPLTTVRLYLQRVIGHDKQNKKNPQAEMLKKADIQVNSMLRLMDSLLNVSMLSNAGLELFNETFNMVTAIDEVAEEMRLKFPWYTFVVASNRPAVVEADKDKIIQVLINYMGNAVKYSPEGSEVKINCKTVNGSVTVSVNDKGMGITPADQANLFGRYFRTNNSGKKGCGLGLYLVKEIVCLHQGDVWVDSMPGKGSTFYFRIPVRGGKSTSTKK